MTTINPMNLDAKMFQQLAQDSTIIKFDEKTKVLKNYSLYDISKLNWFCRTAFGFLPGIDSKMKYCAKQNFLALEQQYSTALNCETANLSKRVKGDIRGYTQVPFPQLPDFHQFKPYFQKIAKEMKYERLVDFAANLAENHKSKVAILITNSTELNQQIAVLELDIQNRNHVFKQNRFNALHDKIERQNDQIEELQREVHMLKANQSVSHRESESKYAVESPHPINLTSDCSQSSIADQERADAIFKAGRQIRVKLNWASTYITPLMEAIRNYNYKSNQDIKNVKYCKDMFLFHYEQYQIHVINYVTKFIAVIEPIMTVTDSDNDAHKKAIKEYLQELTQLKTDLSEIDAPIQTQVKAIEKSFADLERTEAIFNAGSQISGKLKSAGTYIDPLKKAIETYTGEESNDNKEKLKSIYKIYENQVLNPIREFIAEFEADTKNIMVVRETDTDAHKQAIKKYLEELSQLKTGLSTLHGPIQTVMSGIRFKERNKERNERHLK